MMNKILFFFCNLIAVIGVSVLFTTSILKKVMPMLGFAAYKAAAEGGRKTIMRLVIV